MPEKKKYSYRKPRGQGGSLKPRRKKFVRAIPRVNKARGPFYAYLRSDPFPPSKKCALEYTTTDLLTDGVAGVMGTEKVFRVNSLYDVDFSGVGRQPYGFDQMATLYHKYMVHAVKVSLVMTCPNEDGIVVGSMFQPFNGGLTLTGRGVDEIKEKPMCVTRTLNNSGSKVVTLSQYMPIHTIEGIRKSQMDLDLYSALISANPTSTPWFRVAVGTLTGTGTGQCYVRTNVKFYCTFFERVTHGSS